MSTGKYLALLATALETLAGASTSANASYAGNWKRIAAAAETIAGASTTASATPAGYMKRAAAAIVAKTGFSGTGYNQNEAGYLKQIIDALEFKIGTTSSGSLEYRFNYLVGLWNPNPLINLKTLLSAGDSNTDTIRARFMEAPAAYFPANNNVKLIDLRLSGTMLTEPQPTAQTVTFTNGSATIGWSGTPPANDTPVSLFTTNTLPTNFATNTLYFKVAGGLATTVGGTAIVAGSAGSGTHTASIGFANGNVQQQSDVYAVDVTYTPTPLPLSGDGEYNREFSLDSPSALLAHFKLMKGSSRFSDAGAGVRATNWDVSLNDGAYNDAKNEWASAKTIMAGQGYQPDPEGLILSGPANGVFDNTETAAYAATKFAAWANAFRTDFVGNSCPIIVVGLGNAVNQDAFASFSANVTTINNAQKAWVDAEITAGRPAGWVDTNSCAAVEAGGSRLHWSVGSQAWIKKAAYYEVHNLPYPMKYSETLKPNHWWRLGDIRNLPVPETGVLNTAFDFVSQASGLPINPAASGTLQPAIAKSTLANGRAIRGATFDGSNDILIASGAAISINSDFAIFGITKAASSTFKCIFGEGGAGANPFLQVCSTFAGGTTLCFIIRDDLGTTTISVDSLLACFDNTTRFWCVERSGNSLTITVGSGGVLTTFTYGSTFNPPTTSLTKTSIGAGNSNNGTAGNWMPATAYEIGTRQSALNSTTRNNLYSWAQREYGAS